MQKWLDLLTPSAAALSLLLAIALVVQAIRHGRAVRRLESRLAEREGAAARVSLDRLSQLSRRSSTSTSTLAPKREREGPQLPRLGNLAAIAAVIALVLGTSWYLFIRDDGSGSAATSSTGATTTGGTTTQRPQPVAGANDQVPDNPTPLPQSKGAYTILVLNGSGVPKAAANMVPLIEAAGYKAAPPDNASTSDERTSFVMYLPDKQDVADNVAKDLGIKRRVPLDGVSVTQDTQDVDAIVIVGLDLARRSSP